MWCSAIHLRRTAVYLPDSLKLPLKRLARERCASEAELIRPALDEYIRKAARPRPTLPLFGSIVDADLGDRVDELLAGGFGRD
jgi:hypothetical protein